MLRVQVHGEPRGPADVAPGVARQRGLAHDHLPVGRHVLQAPEERQTGRGRENTLDA